MGLKELESASRAQRGVVVLKELKSNPYRVIGAKMVTNDEIIVLATEKEIKFLSLQDHCDQLIATQTVVA